MGGGGGGPCFPLSPPGGGPGWGGAILLHRRINLYSRRKHYQKGLKRGESSANKHEVGWLEEMEGTSNSEHAENETKTKNKKKRGSLPRWEEKTKRDKEKRGGSGRGGEEKTEKTSMMLGA